MRRFGVCVRVMAALGALWLAPAPALAQSLDDGFAEVMERVARAMLIEDLGRDRDAQIVIRQPRDNVYGVVCAPLSRFLKRKFQIALRRSIRDNRLDRARVVDRLDLDADPQAEGGPHQLVVSLTWRRRDDQRYEVATSIGDSTDENSAGFIYRDFEADAAELNEIERRCLFVLEEVNTYSTAEQPLIVYQSIGNYRDELGVVPPGGDYLLIGRIAGMGGWSLVRMLGAEHQMAGVESLGFATLRLGQSPAEMAKALEAASAELAEARDATRRLETEIAATRATAAEQLAAAKRDAAALEDQMARSLAAVSDDLAEAQGRVRALEEEVVELRAEASDGAGETSAALTKALEEAESLRGRLSRAQGDLVSERNAMNLLRGQMAQEIYARNQLQTRLARIEREKAALEERKAGLDREIATLRDAGPRTDAAIRSLERDLGEVTAALTRERRETARLRERVRELELGERNLAKPRETTSVRVLHQVDFDNSNARWLDRQTVRGVSHERCKQICRDDTGCHYYTFNTQHNMCFTKSGVDRRATFRYAISGEMTDRTGN